MAAPRRWSAFSISLAGHIAFLALLAWIDTFQPGAPPQYSVLMLPNEPPDKDKIVWYNANKPLPEVRPDKPFGPFKTPHGEVDPNRTLVTVSPKAESTKQLIRQPDHPEPLPEDVPAPNIVAVAVKPAPKAFVPPTQVKEKAVVAAPVEAPPTPDLPKTQITNALGAITSQKKLPSRLFVPPAARAAGGAAAPEVAVPDAESLGSQISQMPGMQSVIIGLNPGNVLPPPGSRSGQIAKAPEAGTPSSGESSASGAAVVPGVLSHGKSGEMPAPLPPKPVSQQRPSQEIVLPGVNRTMSVPLRPSSRVIPASVEARFINRNVYTLVIPIHAMPGYGGDWVMWFAEHDPAEPGSAPRVSAPIPAFRYSSIDADAGPSGPTASAVQFAALIDKNGRVVAPMVLHGAADSVSRSKALDYLSTWEFKPALRNGEPMEVDVVIEIPFPAAGQAR